jgi:hypothetical protein
VVAPFEQNDLYQGVPSGVPQTAMRLNRFSGCGAAGEIRRLKPFHA